MELSEETKKSLARAEEDIKKGRTYTTKELIKELHIKSVGYRRDAYKHK